MSKKAAKFIFLLLGVAFVSYSAFLYKKSFVDEGYGDEQTEKEVLLGYYVLSLNLENTKQNRDKYRSMTIEELKKALDIENIAPEIK
jgi:hypothetical protein